MIVSGCSNQSEKSNSSPCDFQLKKPIELEEAILKSIKQHCTFNSDTIIIIGGGRLCGNVDDCTYNKYYSFNSISMGTINKLPEIFPGHVFLDAETSHELISDYRKSHSDTVNLQESLLKNVSFISVDGEKQNESLVKIYIGVNDETEKSLLFTFQNNQWNWKETKGRFEYFF